MNDIDHHGTPPRRIPTNEYYRLQWRASCLAAIACSAAICALVSLIFVDALCGYPKTAIWCGAGAFYLAFVAWLKFSQASYYHTLYLRSLITPKPPTE